jgi:hypothetical protein
MTIIAACGAREATSSGDAGSGLSDVRVAAADSSSEESCGFEVRGALNATIEGKPSACACGSEIPFVYFACTGAVDGVTYTLSGQYQPLDHEGLVEVWLAAGDSMFTWFVPSGCTGAAVLDGVAEDGGEYHDGEPIAMSFMCPSIAGDGGLVEIPAATIHTIIGK